MIAFDSSVFMLVIDPEAKGPIDIATGAPVANASKRIEYLMREIKSQNQKIIIPTPVLSEVLVYFEEPQEKYTDILRQGIFKISPFETKAAIEAAEAMRSALRRGGIRADSANLDANRTKIKFDRQIVAIAKVQEATAIYTDDEHMRKLATDANLTARRTADIILPRLSTS